ncbi:MAG: LamG domain-containing protein [Rhodothermaceae bacterium]
MKKLVILLLMVLMVACSEDSNVLENENQLTSKVEFNLGDLSQALKKSSLEDDIHSIIIDVENAAGTVIQQNKKLKLNKLSGGYISDPLSLLTENGYKLTKFLVVDVNENVLYITPKAGSNLAHIVEKPLDISFDVQTNVTSNVTTEVIEAGDYTAEDFGYTTFSFNIIKTVKFLVNAFVFDETTGNYKQTDASITVYGDDEEIYSGNLTNQTNKIVVKDSSDTYKIVVTKFGYKNFEQEMTKAEAQALNAPINVMLQEVELKLFISGDGTNGQSSFTDNSIYNRTLTPVGTVTNDGTVKKYGTASAKFIGNGYLSIPTSQDFNFGDKDFTVDFWVNFSELLPTSYYGILTAKGVGGDNDNVMQFTKTHLGYFEFSFAVNGKGGIGLKFDESTVTANTWVHIALVRSGDTFKLYKNGVNVASIEKSGPVAPISSLFGIGVYKSTTGDFHYMKGNIDNFRVTKGLARWTANFNPEAN